MSNIDNIAAILNKYFKPYEFERFLEKECSVQALLYLERKIIYPSTTYVKFILLA